jgi:hypothetical protein
LLMSPRSGANWVLELFTAPILQLKPSADYTDSAAPHSTGAPKSL